MSPRCHAIVWSDPAHPVTDAELADAILRLGYAPTSIAREAPTAPAGR